MPENRSETVTLTAPCPEKLLLEQAHVEVMLAHLRSVLPEEGCGFLAGRNGRVERVLPVENELHSPHRFQMAPAAMVAALTSMLRQGQQLCAIYHSHPGAPARLSTSDLATLNYREAAQIVVSLRRPDSPVIRVFCLVAGQIREITYQFG